MGLRICFDERYEPVARMVYNCTDTNLTPIFAMPVIVIQHDDWLSPALARVFDIASMKVAVIAIVSANWAETLLFV
jgi:hypothetical protein